MSKTRNAASADTISPLLIGFCGGLVGGGLLVLILSLPTNGPVPGLPPDYVMLLCVGSLLCAATSLMICLILWAVCAGHFANDRNSGRERGEIGTDYYRACQSGQVTQTPPPS